MRYFKLIGIAMAMAMATGTASLADDWPSNPVKFLVPYGAGGGVDTTARLLAKSLSDQTGAPVVVENKPGTSGMIGAQEVAQSAPDGYTLLIAADTTTTAPYVLPNLSFDPKESLVPVTQIALSPFILVVNPDLPINSVEELITFAKEHPKDFRWGVGTIGSSAHLAIEKFGKAAGFDAPEIPYNGEATALPALLSGDVSAMFLSSGAAQPLVKSGDLRALATSLNRPFAVYPDLQPVADHGFEGFEAYSWYAVWAPKGIDPALVEQIQAAVSKALGDETLRSRVSDMGNEVVASESVDAWQDFVASQFDSNKELIESLDLKIQ